MRVYWLFLYAVVIFFASGCNEKRVKTIRNFSLLEHLAHERSNDSDMEDFIDSLMLRMTLGEKIGQMAQLNLNPQNRNENGSETISSLDLFADSVKLGDLIRQYQIGSFMTNEVRSAEEWFNFGTKLQEINLVNANNGIPVLVGISHIHGTNYIYEGTIFPHQLNIGATFNAEFARDMGIYTAMESAHIGHHLNYGPGLGIGRKVSWPGLYETFGEDNYVASVMGPAYIRGLQETKVGTYRMAAASRHFIGYSVPETGWDKTPVDISDQRFYELLVPPFKAAVDSGTMAIVINSEVINGIPVHSSYNYITQLLRDELRFTGVVISDYLDIIKLNSVHYITEDEKESTLMAIMAGIDLIICTPGSSFCDNLKELVEEGKVPEERIDLSVKRILRLKYHLALFQQSFPSNQYYDLIGSKQAEKAAKNAAAESIVLMKNDRKLLPFNKPARLVVSGINADSKMALSGGWSYNWQGNDETLYPDSVKTVFNALTDEFDNTRIVLSTPNALNYNAQSADAIIIVTGEQPYAEGPGNIDDMNLPQDELDLIEIAINTNKPVVLVLLEGRPRIIGDLYDNCQAVLFAGLPGKFGAEAISGILSGRINPSAKMAITYPYKEGYTITYDHRPDEWPAAIPDREGISRYSIGEFGSGESYTNYVYSDLVLSDSVIDQAGRITASVKVKNIGIREGKEAVLWFVSDEMASITRPVKQLKYFEKKFLLPGEVKEFIFIINPSDHLAYPDMTGFPVLEPGYFTLSVGNLSTRFRLSDDE